MSQTQQFSILSRRAKTAQRLQRISGHTNRAENIATTIALAVGGVAACMRATHQLLELFGPQTDKDQEVKKG